MTLSSTTTKVTYNGDGATTDFAISFVFWDGDDLRVIHRDANDVETVWTRGTHYTVTGGSGATGTLTVKTTPTDYTPAAGETLTVKDVQSEVQGDSLPLSGAFPSTVVEQRLDRITRLVQIHSEEIARSILLPETADLSGLIIPEPGAGELVRYNPTGTALETVAVASLSISAIDTLLTGLATNDFLYWDNAQSAWVNITPGATGLALFQDTTAAAARTELGLGTAAVANTGVANGNVPAMDAAGYPAADGSQITGLSLVLRGYIDGLTLSNNATDAAKDIDIAAGVAMDSGNAVMMSLSSTLVKHIDASWAVGTNAGGLDGTESVAGTPDADTWYHVWLIRRSDTGVVDVLFSESATAPTMPTNYDQKRRIGAVLTDAAPDIVAFRQAGDWFWWPSHVRDVNVNNPGVARALYTLTVPTGIRVFAQVAANYSQNPDGVVGAWWIGSPYDDDVSAATIWTQYSGASGQNTGSIAMIQTDALGKMAFRSENSSAGRTLNVWTRGWIDPRGRNS